MFSNGISKYIEGTAKIKNHFPVDFKGNSYVNCYQCRFFLRSSGKCAITGEISEFPQQYVASTCPLEFEEEEQHEEI